MGGLPLRTASIDEALDFSSLLLVRAAISETRKLMRSNVFSITEKTCPKLAPKPIDIFAHTTSALSHATQCSVPSVLQQGESIK
jgi:hypothetical protein